MNRFTLEEKTTFKGTSDVFVEKHRMDNGLKVLICPDPRAPIVSYQTWFSVGSGNEQPGRTGMAHLFEHLMFKETKNLPEGGFDRLMEEHGVQTNAATWVDWTYFYEKLPVAHLELPFRLEADRMENMILESKQLEAEREVVMSERRLRVDDDPVGKMYEVLYEVAYGRTHPYGWPTIGWMEDIKAITLDDCHGFYRTYYAPNNATLVVAGDVTVAKVLDLVERYYGHLKAQTIPEMQAHPPCISSGEKVELTLDLATERVILAYPAPKLGEKEYYAAEVLLEILLNSDSARLTKKLVLETEMATGISGWISGFRHSGLFHIELSLRSGISAEEGIAIIEEEIAVLSRDGVTEREVLKARTKLEAEETKQLLSASAIAYNLGYYETTEGSFTTFFDVLDAVQAVSADDVLEAAKNILSSDRRTIIIARPEEKEEAV